MPSTKTKIIFTIGPATLDPEILRGLLRAGVDLCRINMAHVKAEDVAGIVERVRAAAAAEDRLLATLMDIKGPEIRTGELAEPLPLQPGDPLDLAVDEEAGGRPSVPLVPVNYPGLIHDLGEGSTVLVDNGLLRFRVEGKEAGRLRCRVEIGGLLESRRHINLPGTRVRLPALTEKDETDVQAGVAVGVDYFAQSFVRQPEDVDALRRLLARSQSPARIIAKIEDQQAIHNLDDIIRASDALMVARGDLGIEIPYEDLPLLQHRAVQTCIRLQKPVIVATHMLESMIDNPVPTRAEVSDVALAVGQRTDGIMLSGETAVGKYPGECVQVFKRISEATEALHDPDTRHGLVLRNPKSKLVRSASGLAEDIGDACVIVFTKAGNLPQLLSSLRPHRTPVFAFTDRPEVARQMQLLWGVEPFEIPFARKREATIRTAFARLLEKNRVREGSWAVVITTVLRRQRLIEGVQLRRVEAAEEAAGEENP